jgi:intein-like protein with splicing domain/LAGLIDADG DNA endonuclease family protein
MKAYLAGWQASTTARETRAIKAGVIKNRCLSFANLVKIDGFPWYLPGAEQGYHACLKHGVGIMMDSGVYSFRTYKAYLERKGKGLGNLPEAEEYTRLYVDYCKEFSHLWDFYVTIDFGIVAKENFERHVKLEKMGIRPVPVFHGDDSVEYLRRYADRGYKFICIGASRFDRAVPRMRQYLDIVFNAAVKWDLEFHGLAMTSPWLVLDYPWRSIDSLVGETSFVTIRQYGRVRIDSLEELFWSVPGPVLFTDRGHSMKVTTETEVLSVDREGKVCWKKLKYVIRHKIRKKIYRVQALRGATVDITGDHSLMATTKNSFVLRAASAASLAEDDYLVSAWSLPTSQGIESIIVDVSFPLYASDSFGGSNTRVRQLPYRIHLDTTFLEFVGLWLADGSYGGEHSIQMSAANDTECLCLIQEIADRFQRKLNHRKNGVDVAFSSALLRDIMQALGLKGTSRTKELPYWVFELSSEQRCSLLRGYFSGDGSGGSPSAATSSNKLFYGIALLLRSEGLDLLTVPRYRVKHDSGGFNNPELPKMGGVLRVSGKESVSRFMERIGFLQARQNRKTVYGKAANPATELRTPKVSCQGDSVVLPIYKNDIVWDQYKNQYVYDLSVECTGEEESFLCNGLLVHNSSSWSRAAGYGCILRFDEKTHRMSTLHVSDRDSSNGQLHLNTSTLKRVQREVEEAGYDFQEIQTDHTVRHIYNASTMLKLVAVAEARQSVGQWGVLV